jgi:hypothetical protein
MANIASGSQERAHRGGDRAWRDRPSFGIGFAAGGPRRPDRR